MTLVFIGLRDSDASPQVEINVPASYVRNEVLAKFCITATDNAVVAGINSVDGQIITYLKKTISGAEWAAHTPKNRSFLGDPNLFLLRVPDRIGAENAKKALLSCPSVEYAEKNYYGQLNSVSTDEYFSLQWGLHNDGQSGGTNDADIDAPETWNTFMGSSDVVIAILDTGIDYNHEDLQANIWTNPGESGDGKETNNYDDDGNGYDDDVHGYDFIDDGSDSIDDHYWQQTYHGTHVSGIAAACGNNNDVGIYGVAWNSKLMALKVVDYGENITTAAVIAAIDYALDNGANVMNMSCRISAYSAALYEAVERAMEAGVLLVCSAGSDINVNTDISPQYPSCYDIDNIISVLATDHNDNIPDYSNYGPYTVDLGAPGGSNTDREDPANIFSTQRYNRYQNLDGTSASAPFVTGAVALLLGQRPAINWWQAKTIIMRSVDVKASVTGKARSNGRLNIANALNYSTPVLPASPTNLEGNAYEEGGLFDIVLTWTDNSNNESGFKIYMKTSANVYAQVGSAGANVTSFSLPEVGSGTYYFFVRAYRADGDSIKTAIATVHAY